MSRARDWAGLVAATRFLVAFVLTKLGAWLPFEARVDDRGRPPANAGWRSRATGSSIKVEADGERMIWTPLRRQLLFAFLCRPPRFSPTSPMILRMVLLIGLSALPALTQTYVRSVRGTVTGPDGNPVRGAIVQITNLKTLQIRSFITKKNGRYFFHQLSTMETYELKAKQKGRMSSTETLSKFNTDNPAVVNLKIE